jgi:hypothetical protein
LQQLRRLLAFVLSHVPFIYYLWCIRLVFVHQVHPYFMWEFN